MPQSPTTNLGSFLSSGKKSKTGQSISPSAAIQRLEQEKNRRHFANIATIDLLGREDEIGARVAWWDSRAEVIPNGQIRTLESIRQEIQTREKDDPDWVEIKALFQSRNKYLTYFPDTGPYRRELYPKHIGFMDAGALYRERLFMAANRVGKTECASLEVVFHCTGRYPHWWKGRVFEHPVTCWVVNKSAKDVRDINEASLFGQPGSVSARGTGMIPYHLLLNTTSKSGTPNGIEFADIRHVSGGMSRIQSKSFDQGRESFQGTNIHVVWPDEECPDEVYGEMLMRTLTCNGIILMTYTPINGLTPLTTQFLKDAGIEIEGTPMRDTKDKKAS